MRRIVRKLPRVAAAGSAMAFGYAVYVYLTLPDVRYLASTNPDTTAFIELRAREARSRGQQPRRIQRWVRYSRMSPQLIKAVLVAEDAKFWQHEGIDVDQLMESIEVNIERGEFARGASTITQQLAKNLFLSPAKTPTRKIRELLIARRLETELRKQRILELYLNVIEWGEGVYGAEAAARSYFGKSAAELGPDEAALMAAAIVNPRVLSPGRPTARLWRRQKMILRRMGPVVPPPDAGEFSGSEPSPDSPAPNPEPVKGLPASGTPTNVPGERVPVVPPLPAKPCDNPPCR